jgi:glucosyl-dolichyl phosphate glucuronosyltransferase
MIPSQTKVQYSIIVCTAGDATYLKQCLSAIKSCVTSLNVEVIVINNNPLGELRDNVDRISEAYSFRVVHELRPGLTFARHRGVKESYGDILSFIDDDVIVSDGWFASLQEAFLNHEVVLAGGPSLPIFSAIPKKWVDLTFTEVHPGQSICTWLSLINLQRDMFFVDPNFIWGLNFSIRKDLVLRLNGFNPDLVPKSHERFQGDGETGLTQKIKDLGLRSDYRQGLLVNHVIPDGRLSFNFIKRRARYEGVCNAYSTLRGNSTVPSILRELIRTTRTSLQSVKAFNLEFSFFVLTWEISRVIGYFWFVSIYRKERQVKDWVHLESYIDVDYPH